MPWFEANGLLPGRERPMPWLDAKGLFPGRGPGRGPRGRGIEGLAPPSAWAGLASPGAAGRCAFGFGAPASAAGAAGAAGAAAAGAGAGASVAAGAGAGSGLRFGPGVGAEEPAAFCVAAGAAGAAGAEGAEGPGFVPGRTLDGVAPPGRGEPGFDAAGAAACGCAPPAALVFSASRRRRATGGSTLDDALLTNSPMSCRVLRAVFESTPISLAISCTRGFATFLLSGARPNRSGPLKSDVPHRESLMISPWSDQPFLVVGAVRSPCSSVLACLLSASVSTVPVLKARKNARRSIASLVHSAVGWIQAPRPGRLAEISTSRLP